MVIVVLILTTVIFKWFQVLLLNLNKAHIKLISYYFPSGYNSFYLNIILSIGHLTKNKPPKAVFWIYMSIFSLICLLSILACVSIKALAAKSLDFFIQKKGQTSHLHKKLSK